MNAPKDKSNSKIVTTLLVSLVMLVNIVRLVVGFNKPPVASKALTPDEIYQITGQPVTAEQAEHDFDQKYANGEIARMREIQRSLSEHHANP